MHFLLPVRSWVRAIACAFAILLGTASVGLAQDLGQIQGTVVASDGETLPGATVQILELEQGTTTDASGQFSLGSVPAGTHVLTVRFVGYRTVERSVTVRAGELTAVRVQLPARNVALEGIVVTSQKRVQRVQDVPVAITAYSGDFLDELGISQADELSSYVPGLEVQLQSPNNPGFVVRGITSDNGDSRIEPRVSVFKDGVSISKSRGSVVELYDLERVEVLKGPQGTLFGRGAQIGAVHIIQNKAQNETSARLEIGTGNYGERYATGHFNVPVVEDRLFTRVAGFYQKRDGYLENRAGDALNGKETFAVRGLARWLPTPTTVVDAIVNYQRDTPPGVSFKSAIFDPENSSTDANDPAAIGPDPVLEDDELFIDRTVWSATLLADQDLGRAWTLSSITGFRQFDSLERFDADGTPAPVLQFDEDAQGDQFSQEFRLAYDDDGAFTGFGGASFFWEDGSQRVPFRTDERVFIALLNPDLPLFGPNGEPTVVPAIPNPETGASIPLKDAHQEAFENFGTTSALETFVDGTYQPTDRLSLTAGLRFTFEDVTGEYEVTNSETPGRLGFLLGASPNNLFAPTNGRLSESEQFTSAVGRFVADYAFSDEANVFASVSRGRRPNVINVDADGSTILDAEIVWSYETGIKGRAFNERFEYEANGYYYDYSNFQTSVTELQDGEFVAETRDSGAATAFGFETAVRGALLPGVSVFGNYSYIDATFDEEDENGDPQELANNRFRLTPEHTFALGADITLPVNDRASVFVRPSFTFKSQFFFDEENTEFDNSPNPSISQDAYGLLNVRGGVRLLDDRFTVEGFVKNLLDEEYLIDAGNTGKSFGVPTYIAGPPRLVGIRLSGRF
jgi:outer membrane receptor protein involved in Fe transport